MQGEGNDADYEPTYDVEAFLKRRNIAGTVEWEIKWVGFPSEEATYEPEAQLKLDLGIDKFNECVRLYEAAKKDRLKSYLERKNDSDDDSSSGDEVQIVAMSDKPALGQKQRQDRVPTPPVKTTKRTAEKVLAPSTLSKGAQRTSASTAAATAAARRAAIVAQSARGSKQSAQSARSSKQPQNTFTKRQQRATPSSAPSSNHAPTSAKMLSLAKDPRQRRREQQKLNAAAAKAQRADNGRKAAAAILSGTKATSSEDEAVPSLFEFDKNSARSAAGKRSVQSVGMLARSQHLQPRRDSRSRSPVPQTKFIKKPERLGDQFYQTILELRVKDLSGESKEKLSKVPDRFDVFKDYCNCFMKLMKEECRSAIVQDLAESSNNKHRFFKSAFALNAKGFQLKFKLNNRGGLPEGDLLVLQTDLGTPRVPQMVFCLGSLSRFPNDSYQLNVLVDPTCVLTRQLAEELQRQPVSVTNAVPKMFLVLAGSIVTYKRSCEAIARLDVSPASKNIRDLLWTKDGPSSMKIKNDHERISAVKLDDKRKEDSALDTSLNALNPSQVAAIEMVHDIHYPITMIQGPPGTGKTSTLMVLLQVLFAADPPAKDTGAKKAKVYRSAPPVSKKAKPGGFQAHTDHKCKRILLCAPSNAATDELVRRATQGKLDYLNISVLRIGSNESVAADVMQHTLDAKVADRVKKSRVSVDRMAMEISELQKKLREKESTLAQVKQRVDLLRMAQDVSTRRIQEANQEALENQIAKHQVKLKKLRAAKDEQQRRLSKQNSSARQEVLEESQLICTTLGASGHFLLRNASLEFDTVIIDEAAQCTEPEVLIPLQYDCKKMILVGDPQQLRATVVSLKAKDALLDQSLFERLQKQEWAVRCTRMLSEQYRMHPDISSFPNEHFYRGLLKNSAQVVSRPTAPWHAPTTLSRQRTELGIDRSYMFFDVNHGRETSTSGEYSVCNKDEADFAVHLLLELCAASPNVGFHGRVAFITPYLRQKQELIHRLKKTFGDKIMKSVEVGTVDGFQGQERDIVIFSCVRTTRIGFLSDAKRMNVALTRAKHTLFVLGHRHTLQRDKSWRALVDNAQRRRLLVQAPRSICLPNNKAPKNMFTTATPSNAAITMPMGKPKPHAAPPQLSSTATGQLAGPQGHSSLSINVGTGKQAGAGARPLSSRQKRHTRHPLSSGASASDLAAGQKHGATMPQSNNAPPAKRQRSTPPITRYKSCQAQLALLSNRTS